MNIFPSLQSFNNLLIVMSVLAVIVFVALHFVNAGYGMMYNKKWGISVNNKLGWVLMELPTVVVMSLLWWSSSRTFDTVPLIFFVLFQIHYVQRTFVFPLLMRGKNRMPLIIILFGWIFNIANAYIQGGWIFYLSPAGTYSPDWLFKPKFIAGLIVFFIGFVINLNSDYIIRNLRKPGDTRHYIPRGGMYRYVSSANYFGEWLEWVGFAIFTWSAAGAVFALWTFANLAPRANKIYHRYEQEFGDDFKRLKLKRMIPFIY